MYSNKSIRVTIPLTTIFVCTFISFLDSELGTPADASSLPDCFRVTARAEDDREIMAISHKEHPVEGVQFHPESVLTQYGHKLLQNFIDHHTV